MVRAVVDDLAIPGRYPEVARSLEAELDAGRVVSVDLHARLAALDPVGAARMEPTEGHRSVKAAVASVADALTAHGFAALLPVYTDSVELQAKHEQRFACAGHMLSGMTNDGGF